ncbi:MAG: hypothetical protein JWM32_2084 [Verrucomicrobia bacterium]|nr:hypothetical protein [Verrucomicrobiota bacterium]
MGFMFVSPGSKLWRRKMAAVAKAVGCESMDDLRTRFGPKWAFHLRPIIARWMFNWWDYDFTDGEYSAECHLLEKETGYKAIEEPAWEDEEGNEVRPKQWHGWLVRGELVESFREPQKIIQLEAFDLLVALSCRKRQHTLTTGSIQNF